MFVNILLSLPILLLFVWLAVRCLASWGAPVSLPGVLSGGEAQEHDPPTRRELARVFCWALGLRLLLLLALYVCVMLSDAGPDAFGSKLRLWDAKHYGNLVENGYSDWQEDGQHIFLVFYPLYVWVVRLVRFVIPNTAAAGLTVSFLCFAGGCCYVYRLAAERWGKSVAETALLLLGLFPFSFFYGLVMTESLSLLTTAAACYYATKKKWLLYGIWGALAALTRMTGILVIAVAVIELLNEYQPLQKPVKDSLKKALPQFLRKLPLLLTPLLGALGYLGLNYYVDGDPFAFSKHQAHWHQGSMWISKVLVYIWDYLRGNIEKSLGWATWMPNLVLFILFFCVLVLATRRRENPPSLLAYAFCYLVANYSLSWLLSAGRYLSCGFVFFILAAELLQRRPQLRQFVLGGEAVFLGIYLYGYVTGAHIM